LIATPLQAQRPPLEAYLPADHWSRAALRRLAGTGAVEAGDAIIAWPLTRSRVRELLAGTPYAQHFEREFRTASPVKASLESGWSAHGSQLRAGLSIPVTSGPAYQGPHAIPDDVAPALRAAASVAFLDRFVIAAELHDTTGAARISELYAAVRVGPLHARAGRIPLRLGGATVGGDFLLNAPPPFEGGSLEMPEGFRLPNPIGRVRPTLLVARMERSGDIGHPWFIAARVSFSPARNFVWGLQRAILFGGEGNEAVTPRKLIEALIGFTDTENKNTNFENQMVSGDAFWKLPDIPVSVHASWATDDSGEAFINVPAVSIGADWHVLPFAPSLGVGIEASYISPAKDTYPPWYQHIGLGDGWTDRGTPMGHPLGGHGRELLVSIVGYGRDFMIDGRLFVRHRGRFNLFAPDREGDSVGVDVNGTLFIAGPLRVRMRLDAERHARAGWSWSTAMSVGARL
jgi:hypothetical protein